MLIFLCDQNRRNTILITRYSGIKYIAKATVLDSARVYHRKQNKSEQKINEI